MRQDASITDLAQKLGMSLTGMKNMWGCWKRRDWSPRKNRGGCEPAVWARVEELKQKER